jgi:hypothetical protein
LALFRYRLFDIEGEGVGEIDLEHAIRPGDHISAGRGRNLRVVSVAPVADPESQFDALLMVAPAETPRAETEKPALRRFQTLTTPAALCDGQT